MLNSSHLVVNTMKTPYLKNYRSSQDLSPSTPVVKKLSQYSEYERCKVNSHGTVMFHLLEIYCFLQ